jgi:hypothetical protein
MKGIPARPTLWKWRRGAALWLVIAAVSLGKASAQTEFAKVVGIVTDTQNVKVANSSVRVMPSGAHTPVDAPIGEYSINNLQAGKYIFIGCGLPYRPDIHRPVTVKPDEVTTINFVLKDPPRNERKASLTLDGFREASTDGVAYLRDPASGCLVAQARPNEKGEVEFTTWKSGDQVCIRERGNDKNREEFTCPSTITTSS